MEYRMLHCDLHALRECCARIQIETEVCCDRCKGRTAVKTDAEKKKRGCKETQIELAARLPIDRSAFDAVEEPNLVAPCAEAGAGGSLKLSVEVGGGQSAGCGDDEVAMVTVWESQLIQRTAQVTYSNRGKRSWVPVRKRGWGSGFGASMCLTLYKYNVSG